MKDGDLLTMTKTEWVWSWLTTPRGSLDDDGEPQVSIPGNNPTRSYVLLALARFNDENRTWATIADLCEMTGLSRGPIAGVLNGTGRQSAAPDYLVRSAQIGNRTKYTIIIVV